VPTPVVAGESVEFIHDDRSHATKEAAMIDPSGDHHRLEWLWCGQKDLWWITKDTPACRFTDISVPEADPETDEGCVPLKSWFEVVEQSLKWANV
jgi:hypothetical protein